MQNNKKYWLRGGVVGFICLVVYLIYAMSTLSSPFSLGTAIWVQTVLNFLETLFSVNLIDGRNMLGYTQTKLGFYVILFLITCVYVIGGCLIGWIYGKIRNRNRV